MRVLLLSLTTVSALGVAAQCSFNPTITPAEVILCPNEDAVLSTQEYDAYQWYRGGEAIDGATEQTLTIPGFDATGYEFTVEVTLEGCTEMSPARFVDGWIFLLPFVIHGGDEPYLTNENGQYNCVGDTVTLDFSYPMNVQWTNGGVDIPGATSPTLEVTTSGVYHASGAPAVCPDYISNLGVEIAITFTPSSQSTIEVSGDQLCATPTGISYIWYIDGEAIVGSNSACITPQEEGSYTVLVDQGEECQMPSEPYLATGMTDRTGLPFTIAPNPASTVARIIWPADQNPTGTWNLMDLSGRSVRRGAFSSLGQVSIDVRELANGKYLFNADMDGRWAPVSIVVAH